MHFDPGIVVAVVTVTVAVTVTVVVIRVVQKMVLAFDQYTGRVDNKNQGTVVITVCVVAMGGAVGAAAGRVRG